MSVVIDKTKLRAWLESRFGEVRARGHHLMVNDPLGKPDGRPDTGFNLVFWTEGGSYKSWLPPQRHGSLVKFVMETDGVTWQEAVQTIGQGPSSTTNVDVNEIITSVQAQQRKVNDVQTAVQRCAADLPPGFSLFSTTCPMSNTGRHLYDKLVKERGIFPDLFGVGFIEPHLPTPRELSERWPDMSSRIIIPYYDPDGNVVYWTARDTVGKEPVYFNAPLPMDESLRARYVGRDNAVWCFDWSKKAKLYMCEGAFDAMSLNTVGLAAIAVGGATVSDGQFSVIRKHLKPEVIVVAMDNDAPGLEMSLKAATALRRRGWKVLTVTPPTGYKDWNKLWQSWRDPGAMKAWVEANESSVSFALEIQRELDKKPKHR